MTELLEILYGVGAVGTGFVLARHLSHGFRGASARRRWRCAVMLWPAALIWLGWDRRDQERFETREEHGAPV